jgi:hypothetical protein
LAGARRPKREDGRLLIREVAGAHRPKHEDGVSRSSRPKKPKAEESEWTPPPEYSDGQLRYAVVDDPK